MRIFGKFKSLWQNLQENLVTAVGPTTLDSQHIQYCVTMPVVAVFQNNIFYIEIFSMEGCFTVFFRKRIPSGV